MLNVNETVKVIQSQGTAGKESFEFSELFMLFNNKYIEPKAKSFERQLKGDVADGISAGFELLTELVDTWDGTGSFTALFNKSFRNRLINLVESKKAKKRSHNTNYDFSIDYPEQETEQPASRDIFEDPKLHTTFDITDSSQPSLLGLLDKFKEKNPEQGGVIDVMIDFHPDMKKYEKTKLLCEYYGVEEYTPIQKKVSRAKKAFEKFLQQNHFSLV